MSVTDKLEATLEIVHKRYMETIRQLIIKAILSVILSYILGAGTILFIFWIGAK